jgi:hypothetical protein
MAMLPILGGAAFGASALDLSLEAEIEHRHFPVAALHAAQHGDYSSLALIPEAYQDWDGRHQSVTVQLFGRLNQYDDERTHADVREAFYRHTTRHFEWRIGVRQVFWGALESVHLADVINQTDFVEEIDGEDKLGQPSVDFSWYSPIGTFDVHFLPTFRERTYPGEEGRLRPLLPVDTAAARVDDEHPGYAVRYFNTFGNLDAGLYWFYGTGREPRFDTAFDACEITLNALFQGNPVMGTVTCEEAEEQFGDTPIPPEIEIQEVRVAIENARFVPVYDRVTQVGLDLQYVTGGLSLKAEAIHRHADDYHFSAAGAGLEYTLYDFFGSGYDLGLLAEYLYDNRGGLDPDVADAGAQLSRNGEVVFGSIERANAFQAGVEETQNAASFQDDLFLGMRLTLNDLAGSEILAGVIRDLETEAVFGTLEASRRFFSVYRVALTGQLFSQIPATDPLYGFRDDDHLELTITRFF